MGPQNTHTILIIDDDLPIRFTLKKLLSRYLDGLKIYTSGDGVDGLGLAYVTSPDLIVIDTTLPKYGGRELIEYMRTNPRFAETPVIVLREADDELDLPGNYTQISKRDKRLPLMLITEVMHRLHIEQQNGSENTRMSKLVNYVSRMAVKFSNFADVHIRGSEQGNTIKRILHFVVYLLCIMAVSLNLVTLEFLTGRWTPEENIEQRKRDLLNFRVKYYPTVALLFAAIIILIIQLVAIVGGALSVLFVGNKVVLAAAYTWDGGGTDGTCGGAAGDGNKWSCAANWSSDIVPTSTDTVTFNSTSTKDATVDAGFAGVITSINIASGYTGTITMARSLQTTGTFTQGAGTFTAANQTLDVDSTFTLSAGAFTASSGTIFLSSHITISGSPTFNANGGTLSLDGAIAANLACNNVTFNLVVFAHTTNTKVINSDCTIPVGANPTFATANLTTAVTNNGIISGSGTITAGILNLNTGSSLTGFSGLDADRLTVAGATSNFGSYSPFTISENTTVSSGTLTLPSGADLNGQLIISGGTFNAPSGTMTVAGALTISGSPTFNANGGTITFDSATAATLACNNVTFNRVNLSHSDATIKTINSDCNLPLGAGPTITGRVTVSGTLSGSGTLNATTTSTNSFNAGAAFSGFTGYSQTSGTFNVNGATINFGSYTTASFFGFAGNSGSFTAPTGTMSIAGGMTMTGSPAIFVANGGTVNFGGTVFATLSCNNIVFNLVTFTHTGVNEKVISSNCSLPLGASPTITGKITLSGTLSGSGTVTLNTSDSPNRFNAGAVLSGFSGWTQTTAGFTVQGATFDLSSYSPFVIGGATTVSSGSLTLPSGADLNASMTISGGTFNAPSGAMTLAGSLTISGSPTFNANGGTITFDGSDATLSCNSVSFNLVQFTNTGGVKTVNSNCSLPLGNNPSASSGSIVLNGTLSGTGTLAKTGGTLTLNTGSSLSGFSGLTISGLAVAGATANLSSYSPFTASGLVSISSGSLSLPSGADLNGSLTISGGTFNAPSGLMTLANNLTITGSPTFNANGGTITFDGTLNTALACNNVVFNLVTLGHSGAVVKTINSDCNLPLGNNPTITDRITLSGTLSGTGTITSNAAGSNTFNAGSVLSGFSGWSQAAGTFTVAGANLNLGSYSTANFFSFTTTSGTFTAPAGIMNVAGGTFSLAASTFTANGGTVNFNGTSSTVTCNSNVFNLVTLNNTGTVQIQSNCNIPLGNNPTTTGTGGLTINGGTISGTGTFTKTVGNINVTTGSAISGFSGLAISSMSVAADLNFTSYSTFSAINTITLTAGSLALPSGADLNGTLNITGGTFTAPSGTMTVAGDLNMSGTPVFNHNNGTIVLDGADQVIQGSRTFNSLSKVITTPARTLTFPAGGTQTILGTLTLKGTAGNLLSLVSSTPGTAWTIDPQGAIDIAYLSVTNSTNIDTDYIQTFGKNISNGGNNIKWNFNYPIVSNMATASAWGRGTSPNLSFSIADPDVAETVKYRIQIDNNADFTSPEADFTSALAPQGSFNFTSGPLGDGNYNWRVKATDNTTGEADFYTGPSFGVDATQPTGFMIINEGEAQTTSRDVVLRIFGEDLGSGIAGMLVSESPVFTGAVLEPLVGHKDFTLSPGAGTRTIYIKFRDVAGNESQVYSDSIGYQAPITSTVETTPSGSGPVTPPAPGQPAVNVDFRVKILDSTGQPLSNIELSLYDIGIILSTNAEGYVQFTDIPTGNHLVLGALDGREFEQTIIADGSVEEYRIVLDAQPQGNSALLYVIIAILLLIIIFSALFYWFKSRQNQLPQYPESTL